MALLTGVAVWMLTGCNRDGGSASGEGLAGARIVNTEELSVAASDVGHGVYWAGERPDTQIEFSDDATGNVHVRYLTDGAEAGAAAQTYLDVGTYPFEGAFEATKNLAEQNSLAKVPLADGVGFYDKKRPYSVILAFPDEPDLQVEVYHPEKNGALEIVRSGAIVPLP